MRNFATWESLMGGRVSLSREARSTTERASVPAKPPLGHAAGWDKQKFAQEQIRGMMLQIFFSSGATPTRHVVFSATEAENDVHNICLQVGESLALETLGNIAVVGQYPQICQTVANDGGTNRRSELHKRSTRLRSNLWLVSPTGSDVEPKDFSAASRHAFLSDLRSQFEYSIVAGPPACEWNQAAAIGQLADGVVLVLSAQRTRRIAARNLKEGLEMAQTRILGTVLTDREFPLPESLYRRL
jgi:hypothetical protein